MNRKLNYKERRNLRRRVRWGTFNKGVKSWISLVIICFIFSFLGATDSTATSFIHPIDEILGLVPDTPDSNTDMLKEYVLQEDFSKNHPFLSDEVVTGTVDALTDSYSWIVNLLAANTAYFERNTGAVWWTILFAALLAMIVRLIVQNALIVGKHRFVMEQRYETHTTFKRAMAPFHRKYIPNIIWVMLCTHVQLILWACTIFVFPVKFYEYRMIPYILAENPSIRFKEARKQSRKITKGNKWNMFLIDLSMIYLYLLETIPVIGLLVAVPMKTLKNAEMYFFCRNKREEELDTSVFVERTFDLDPWWDVGEEEQSVIYFQLENLMAEETQKKYNSLYSVTDYTLFFFVFSFGGWVWEVFFHFIKHFNFVNRGTLYGPWLPIYGVGGVLCILLLDRFKKKPIKTFFLIMVISGIVEFITSWVLDFFFNSSYWEYHNWFANINGRICLAGLIAFGLGGCAAIYIVGPFLRREFRKIPEKIRVAICVVLLTCFIIDLVCCAAFGFNSGSGVGNTF